MRSFGWLLLFVLLATGSLFIFPVLAPGDWRMQLLTHFRLQFFALLCIAFFWSLFGSMRRKSGVAITALIFLSALVIYAGVDIFPYFLPRQSVAVQSDTLSILHMNVFSPNRQFDKIAEAIRQYEPDIVELMEYTETSRVGLEKTGVFKKYPYHITGKSHLGIYSKRPFISERFEYIDGQRMSNYANLLLEMKLGNQPITLLVAHPHWPVMNNEQRQRQHFLHWVKSRELYGKNLILIGDLNTAPWSRNFKYLVQHSDLRDSQLGFGVQPSWPVFVGMPFFKKVPSFLYLPFRIPIDHVLVSKDIIVLERKIGPVTGSDHLPVFVRLGMRN